VNYRISGIKKNQDILYQNYLNHSEQETLQDLAFQIQKNLSHLKKELKRKKISENNLALNSKTNLFNTEGLISLILNQPHRYCEIFNIINTEKKNFSKLYHKKLGLKFTPPTHNVRINKLRVIFEPLLDF